MQTLLGIYNMALSLVGARRAESMDEQTKGLRLCGDFFDSVRDSALALYAWEFAVRQEQLEKGEDAPSFGHAFAYTLPDDCIKVLEMSPSSWAYAVIGRTLQTSADSDVTPVAISFVARVDDPALFSPAFYKALGLGLAEALCVPLLGAAKGAGLASLLARRFALALDEAMSADAAQLLTDTRPRDIDPWLAARSI
jgi:hypothetical protein